MRSSQASAPQRFAEWLGIPDPLMLLALVPPAVTLILTKSVTLTVGVLVVLGICVRLVRSISAQERIDGVFALVPFLSWLLVAAAPGGSLEAIDERMVGVGLAGLAFGLVLSFLHSRSNHT